MKLIIANWKLNPVTVGEAVRLARAEDQNGVVITPPFPFIPAVHSVLKRAKLGAQDAFWVPKGPYTGEVSAHQLRHLRAVYVIVGHSERRARGESDAMVNRKVRAALAEGVTPVLCVGEPWSVRKKGMPAAKRYVAGQLRAALKGVPARHVIVAYEPIWAIGSGKADKPAEAAEIARFIKKLLAPSAYRLTPRVLYGGSVTPRNASAFLRESSIDGALVGGASLKPREFRKIVATVKNSQ